MKAFTLTGDLEIHEPTHPGKECATAIFIGGVNLGTFLQEHFGAELADDLGLKVRLLIQAEKPDRTKR